MTEQNRDIEADSLTDAQRWRGLAVVMVSAVTVGMTLGMTIPLIALSMTAAGAGAALVGINAAMPALAVLATAPLAPRLIGRLGTVPTLVLGCLVSALALALFPVLGSVPAWFGLRFAMGFGLALQWVVSETWLSRIAVNASRGRAVSLYATLWAAGIATGPLLLQVTGIEGLKRVSKPGLRRYVGATEIPRVRGGLGVAIVSTSEGLLTDQQARKKNLGGELLCYIW